MNIAVFEARPDGYYDANGVFIGGFFPTHVSVEQKAPIRPKAEITAELIQQGVSVEDVIKLKNQGLLD